VGTSGIYHAYHATVHPWLWFLTRSADCRIFQNKTVPDIIKEVLKEQGFTDIKDALGGVQYRSWEYCVQYRETDFDFVSRLMEQEGIYYFFTHEQNKHTMVLANTVSSHEPFPEYEQITYYPPENQQHREEDHIFDWTLSQEVQSGIYALNDYDFKQPKANLQVKSSISRKHDRATMEIFDYPGEYVTSAEGEAYVRSRVEELQAEFERAHGQANARGLAVGSTFKLQGYPRNDQNREYLVVSATHSLESDAYDSSPSAGNGEEYSCTFSTMHIQEVFRPARLTPKPIVQGPQTAVVVGPSGEEIYTDKYGRVKVQFHWDRYGKRDENSSCWVRVSHPTAGKSWGSVQIPRVDQEVIISFLEGDPDQPIITGRVYNADQMPPHGLPKAGMVSGMKSNSTPGGGGYNEMSMDDTKGKEKITVHGQYDMNTSVEHDQTLTVVSGNRSVTVQAGTQTETIKGDASVTVQAGSRTVSVTGGDYSASASDGVTIHGKSKGVMITGDAEGVGLTGNGKGVGIKGTGEGVGIEGLGKGVGITGKGDGVGINGEPDVFIDGKSNVTIKSPTVDIGDKEINISGTKVVISAGGGSIVIDATGITIKGTLVKIN
jgi:type VI secretion system secreted protein VgrG